MRTQRKSEIEKRARKFLEGIRTLDGIAEHLTTDEEFERIVQEEVRLTISQITATGGAVIQG